MRGKKEKRKRRPSANAKKLLLVISSYPHQPWQLQGAANLGRPQLWQQTKSKATWSVSSLWGSRCSKGFLHSLGQAKATKKWVTSLKSDWLITGQSCIFNISISPENFHYPDYPNCNGVLRQLPHQFCPIYLDSNPYEPRWLLRRQSWKDRGLVITSAIGMWIKHDENTGNYLVNIEVGAKWMFIQDIKIIQNIKSYHTISQRHRFWRTPIWNETGGWNQRVTGSHSLKHHGSEMFRVVPSQTSIAVVRLWDPLWISQIPSTWANQCKHRHGNGPHIQYPISAA